MTVFRRTCALRHENGNCLVIGGFCTSVNDEICTALQGAYKEGYCAGVQAMVKELELLSHNGNIAIGTEEQVMQDG